MFARATLFDIDTMRISIEGARERFREFILPALHQAQGYRGVYALTTPEGKGILLTLWERLEDAEAGLASGFYEEQVQKFLSFYREPPGREQYEVTFAEVLEPVH